MGAFFKPTVLTSVAATLGALFVIKNVPALAPLRRAIDL